MNKCGYVQLHHLLLYISRHGPIGGFPSLAISGVSCASHLLKTLQDNCGRKAQADSYGTEDDSVM